MTVYEDLLAVVAEATESGFGPDLERQVVDGVLDYLRHLDGSLDGELAAWHIRNDRAEIERLSALEDPSAQRQRVAHGSASAAERRAVEAPWPTAPARLRVLDAIAAAHPDPVTPKQVGRLIGKDRDSAHPRMRELHLDGWIARTGDVREGTDTDGDLWALTDRAIHHLEAL